MTPNAPDDAIAEAIRQAGERVAERLHGLGYVPADELARTEAWAEVHQLEHDAAFLDEVALIALARLPRLIRLPVAKGAEHLSARLVRRAETIRHRLQETYR